MARKYIGRTLVAANSDLDAAWTVARGGTGVATVALGALLLGANLGAMTELAPGASGGYVRSDGTTWARATGVAAADLQAGTLTGAFVFATGPSVTAGTTALQAVTATSGTFSDRIFAGAANALGWTGRSLLLSPSDGAVTMRNNADTAYATLQVAGFTATTGTFSGAVSGITTLAGTGAISGFTSIAMNGALSGATTGAFSGAVSVGQLILTDFLPKIVSGGSGLTIRNNADSANNLLINDDGSAVFRAGVSGITTLAGTGAISGFTTLGLSGAITLTGATADLKLATAGSGIYIKEGSNATMGVETIGGGGTNTVNTTKVTANSRIFLTSQGALPFTHASISARTPGTSFAITGSVGDVVAWLIVEPS